MPMSHFKLKKAVGCSKVGKPGPSQVLQIKMAPNGPPAETEETAPVARTTLKEKKKSQAQKYKDRDAHQSFFRPKTKQETVSKQQEKKKNKKKQRKAWAHEHYIVHHGSTTEASLFL